MDTPALLNVPLNDIPENIKRARTQSLNAYGWSPVTGPKGGQAEADLNVTLDGVGTDVEGVAGGVRCWHFGFFWPFIFRPICFFVAATNFQGKRRKSLRKFTLETPLSGLTRDPCVANCVSVTADFVLDTRR